MGLPGLDWTPLVTEDGKRKRDMLIPFNASMGHYNDLVRKTIYRISAEGSPHGGNSISSGMAAGSLAEASDVDCAASTGAPATTASTDDDGGDPDPEPARPRTRKEHQTHRNLTGRASIHALSHSQTSDDAGAHMAKTSHRAVSHDATATAGDLKSIPQHVDIALWRLPTVLAHVPVSRSGWWAGVKSGRYPQPVRLSARCVAWRASDVRSLIDSL